jgi:hypothetical protein
MHDEFDEEWKTPSIEFDPDVESDFLDEEDPLEVLHDSEL